MTSADSSPLTKKLIGGFYSFIVAFTFCVHFFVAKDVLQTISPTMLGAVRGVIGGLILYVLFFKQFKGHLTVRKFVMMLIIAFFGYFINQVMFLGGLKLSTPLHTAVIMNTIPVVTAIIAMLAGVEHFAWRKIFGCILGFAMIAILIAYTSKNAFGEAKMGDALIFGSVITLCISTMLTKKLVKRDIPASIISGSMLFFGGLALTALVPDEIKPMVTYSFANTENIIKMVFEIFIATSLIYLLSFKALQYLSPSQSMIFIYLQPVMTAGIDYFMFAKIPPMILAPVFFGVIIAGYLVVSAKTH